MSLIDRPERSFATGPERGRRTTTARVEHLPPAWPLLEAKLESPGERVGAVDRERVVSTLLAPPGSSIVSLVAPPGYGKTTVLAQWAAREPRPVAWLTLDALDNDPVILVRYLVAALGRIGPMDPSIATGHAASRDRILGAAMPRLVSEVYRWREPALLILDDAHRLEDRTCLDALTALLDHLPPNLSVALAGRTEPAVPFGRYRAAGQLLEIGPASLALDVEETAALARASGCELDADGVLELHRRTEGWPVGTYLASIACRRAGSQRGVSIAVSGGDRYIASYLASELTQSLGEDDLRFLTRTAIVEVVTPGVAEVVAGMPDAGARLESLVGRHLLIQEVGRRPLAYRYHNLLREFLLAELERREPGRSTALHRTAAAWYRDSGNLDLAIEHALAAGALDEAATIVATSGPPLYDRGHFATVERRLGRLNPADFERHPSVAILAGWVHLQSGRPADAVRMAAIADGAVDPGVLSHGSGSFESQRALLRAVMCPDGPRRMLADASLAVDEARPDSQWHANALWLQSAAHLLLGNLETADEILGEAVADGEYGATLTVGAWALQAGIRIRRGDWDGAGVAADEARRRLVALQSDDLLSALAVFAVAARVAIRRGDFDLARDCLVRAQLVRPLASHAAPWISVDALLEIARAYLAISDPAGAQIALREAEQIVRRASGARDPHRGAHRDPGTARRLDLDAGRFVRPDERGTADPAAAADVPVVPGHRRPPGRVTQHGQDARDVDLRQGLGVLPRRGGRTSGRTWACSSRTRASNPSRRPRPRRTPTPTARPSRPDPPPHEEAGSA